MGLWALSSGDVDNARRWLRRARRIDQFEERTKRLEKRLTEQSPSSGPAVDTAGPEQSKGEVES